MTALAHIANLELGLSVRTKLNSLIDQYNTPLVFPAGGGTTGSVLFIGGSGAITEDNANFFWDDAANNLQLGGQLKIKGATSGTVSLSVAATAGTWTLQLPTTGGTANYFLQTNGAGVTTWAAAAGGGGGGMAIGGAITGATPGSVLFVDGSSLLGQDPSNFSYNVTHNSLLLQGQNAVYRVPNASGDNWFEGDAGNFTVTGYSNFGTGSSALSALTTGTNNLALGTQALFKDADGSYNTAIGTNALFDNVSGIRNTALGYNALATCNANDNVGMGFFAGLNITTGVQNVALGTGALQAVTTGQNNCAIGTGALQALSGNAQSNVALGSQAFTALSSGNYNVGVGITAGVHWTSGTANVCIGYGAGFQITSGSGNTLIGTWEGPVAAVSNVIAITDGNAYAANFDKILGVDYNYTTARVWSYQYLTTPIGLRVYNTTDGGAPPTNYERACLDWNLTSNVFRIASQAAGTGVVRLIAIDGFGKAGAPAAGDLPSGTWALIDDTSGGQTWLVFNKAGTIRKVQLV